MQILEDIPLAPFTTLQVGGPARYFAEPASLDEIREALAFAHSKGLPLFVLGGGSNLVVADSGFPGLVLRVQLRGIAEAGNGGFAVASGESWDDFVARSVTHDCAGIECLSGIPGSVGGTPVQNVGAYGQEVSQTITSVEALEIASGSVNTFSNSECGFGYRSSRFNTSECGRWLILRTTFALVAGGSPQLAYRDLQQHFALHSGAPTLGQVRDAVRAIRRSKAMLLVQGDDDCRSAGSFFKNPVLDAAAYAAIQQRAAQRGLTLPAYPSTNAVGHEQYKVPAAWLVEHAGFHKGFTLGRAGISSRHTLAIINRGVGLNSANAAEIVALKDAMQNGVEERWQVRLEPEPVMLGF